ncbi:histidine kinase [Pedobacter metabolipauper]|uniref:Histidine kinase n=1 Tax=Pedobacter metabolipauper TaxID=425513 RepID=A0A4R6SV31_9SPHI|nr:histidine kinase [Pedobacter metabolipauper]TDQ08299.1 histidine kinase [Pedobacter metabolipauper]
MRGAFLYVLILLCCCTWYGCKEKVQKNKSGNTEAMLLVLQQALEKQRQNPDLDSKLAFWSNQLSNPKFSADSVLLSKIHYNIAGVFYAMSKLDSIKNHMQIAWLLMENKAGFEEEKIQLYSGLGNVAHLEQKLHQENYYYNRAAQMLTADTSIKLTAKQKINIYFSAAQSCTQLRQFENAFMLNRKAIALLPDLEDNPKDSFRAYSQMAWCYSASGENADSLHHYIKKMEKISVDHPDDEKKRFVYDRKASYFIQRELTDSALIYSRKRLAMDLADAEDLGPLAASVKTGNLYVSYIDLAGVFIELKQLDSAKYYLERGQDFAKKYAGSIDDESLILYEQNRLSYFFAIKNYAEAEKEQNILSQRTRFLYETENARAIAEMGALFQLQAKDKSINHLNETVLLSETKLQRNRLWLAVTMLAFLLAITVALLLYFIQRQRKLKAETEKAQLEQRLLRTQMEPHFIFNTLSALQSFIRFNDNVKALKYLHQFGRLLRSSLESSRESLVKLSDEIDTLNNYLSLQQMRYDDGFTYQIHVDEEQDIESICLPPMLIQPFVENAILHGIDPNGKKGIITVNFDVRQEILLVTIKDNGKGPSTVVKPASHKSLSTTITKERLAILAKEHGSSAGIDIKIDENKGTVVVISIPIKEASNFSNNK